MSQHSAMGPSTLQRRSLCPGSYRMEKDLPDCANEASENGTRLHDILARSFAGKITRMEALLEAGDDDYAIQTGFNFVDRLKEQFPSMMLSVEETLDMDFLGAGEKGTLDLGIIEPFVSGMITDFKFTYIDPPTADKNLQVAAYAVAFAEKYELQRVDVAIVLNFRGWCSRFTFDAPALAAVRGKLAQIADACRLPFAPLIPSTEACRYCKAALSCPANLARIKRAAECVGTTTTFEAIPPSELGAIHFAMEPIKAFLAQVDAALFRCITAGAVVDGLEVSPARGRRVWVDNVSEEQLAKIAAELKALVSDAGKPLVKRDLPVESLIVKKLVSPAQLEEQWGTSKPVKEALKPLMWTKPGELHLRPAKKEEPADGGTEY